MEICCWWNRLEKNIHTVTFLSAWTNHSNNIIMEVYWWASLNAQNFVPWSRWATAVEDYTKCHSSCQITRNWSYIFLKSEKSENRRLKKQNPCWFDEAQFLLWHGSRARIWQTTWRYGSIMPWTNGSDWWWWCNGMEYMFLTYFRILGTNKKIT